MLSVDINHNASRIYQDLVQQLPRRRSMSTGEAPTRCLQQQKPSEQWSRRTHESTGMRSCHASDAAHETARLLLPEETPKPSHSLYAGSRTTMTSPSMHPFMPCISGSRIERSDRPCQRTASQKQHTLAHRLGHASVQHALQQQTPQKIHSRCIPPCFEPMASYLIQDLALKEKSQWSRLISYRTKKGESLQLRCLRVTHRFSSTRERLQRSTVLFVLQGRLTLQGRVLCTGQSARIGALEVMEARRHQTSDALVLAIGNGLDSFVIL